MSLIHSEESPLSDGKMDISETTSLDSAGTSLNDNNERMMDKEIHHHTSRLISKSINYNNHSPTENHHLRSKNTTNSLEWNNDNEVINKISLDNRIITKPLENLSIASMEDSLTPQRRNIARTLADNHPLMLSPTCTDSDSEFDHIQYNYHNKSLKNEKTTDNGIQVKNYPDVVPTRERLHIPRPLQADVSEEEQEEVSILNSKNINCDRKIISDFVKTNNKPTTLAPVTHQLKPHHLKNSAFRASSPDLLSSGSEVNVSQYQATVDANYQTVALLPKKELLDGAQNKHLKNAKKAEDILSLDSISNHSFDGDEDHNLASLSPSSSLIDGLDDDDDDDCEGPELLPDDDDDIEQYIQISGHLTPTPGRSLNSPCGNSSNNQELPQYSAAEERRDSRNWQKITLPDGRTRDIDMRVIEPYKRVLSHGGYFKAGGHNAIVIFCACHLPDRSRTDYSYVMDNLFLYVVKTLEQLVTDDYVLIYLHGGSSRRNMPPFPWLKKCYQLLDRRLRKSLKNMYLVHPTFWIKSIIWMTRPFVSLIHSEESPLSDGKMDISETTSLDSAGTSLNDNNERMMDKEIHHHTSRLISKSINYNNHSPTENHHLRSKNTTNSLEWNNDNEVINKISLDNRIITKPLENLSIASMEDSLTPQRRNIARTLADNHPLMLSPTCTDSDSEFDHIQYNYHNKSLKNEKTTDNGIQVKNYPDVVPTRERLHIPRPLQADVSEEEQEEVSILNSKNINCDRKIISDFVKTNNKPTTLAPVTHQLKPHHLKNSAFRASSPDLLSSGSEVNVSQYQATVDANYQTVALLPKKELLDGAQNKHLKNAKKAEDILSLDSISNHSFDGDEDHNLASLSPSSSLIDGLDDDDDDDCEGPELLPDDDDDIEQYIQISGHLTPTPGRSLNSPCGNSSNNQELPQYSAAEERRDSRNWQKITLPDGRTRDIDMRVIEPYKRVLSHGGYLKAGGHNAIVIFCACHLPDRSRTDYSYVMDNLFLYVVKTLEQLVTDDYVLIYLHGGSSRRNMPPFPWLKKCYQLLDRRLRKSLKNMYLVHPTFWIKSIIWMTRPFVSTKFWRKLVYVKSLDELSKYVTALEKAAIPEKVKQYDSKKH